jgi:hypothetical protein
MDLQYAIEKANPFLYLRKFKKRLYIRMMSKRMTMTVRKIRIENGEARRRWEDL